MEVKRCLRGNVVDGSGGRKAKVVVFELWLFGDDVGGGDLVVGGWLVQNNDRKRKTAISKSRSPMNHEQFPLTTVGTYLNTDLPA